MLVLNFCFRFDDKDSVIGIQQLKSSVQKGIRTKIIDQYPTLEEYIDMILPKKDALRIVKWLVGIRAYLIDIFIYLSM
jgi:hypothetical protein